jgi:hypothetical protein
MATWNHRVVRKKLVDDFDDEQYGIHEVHYDEDRNPVYVTENPVVVAEMNTKDLQETLIRMLHATTLPALDYEDFQ